MFSLAFEIKSRKLLLYKSRDYSKKTKFIGGKLNCTTNMNTVMKRIPPVCHEASGAIGVCVNKGESETVFGEFRHSFSDFTEPTSVRRV